MNYIVEIGGKTYGPFASPQEAMAWANWRFPERNPFHDPVRFLHPAERVPTPGEMQERACFPNGR